jgi:DNA-binding NarL/FixJ family response regulator
MNEDVQALLDAGAGGFVMKPYSVETLAQSLENAIAKVNPAPTYLS